MKVVVTYYMEFEQNRPPEGFEQRTDLIWFKMLMPHQEQTGGGFGGGGGEQGGQLGSSGPHTSGSGLDQGYRSGNGDSGQILEML